MTEEEKKEEIIEDLTVQSEGTDFNDSIILENTLDYKILNSPTITGGAKLNLGSGDKCFKFEADKGIWLGHADYASAPAKISMAGIIYGTGAIIDGTSTIGGRVVSTVATAIDASGHFADDAISTATNTIIGNFTFTPITGGLQIGTYVNGESGDIRISQDGILGRSDTGATTFSIDGTTGVAVLNGLVVGTNVGLGTAQDSAGVTTIVGNVVTTGYVNALSVVAGSIAAENITAGIITGSTLQTNSAGNNRVQILDSGETYPNQIRFYNSSNVLCGSIITDFSASGGSFNISAEESDNIELAAGGYTRLTVLEGGGISVSGNIAVTGTVDGVDVAAHKARHQAGGSDAVIRTTQASGNNLGISAGWAYTHDNTASAHHSSVSDNLTITPAHVNIKADGYIRRVSTAYVRLTSTAFDMYKPIVLNSLSSDPTGEVGMIFYSTGTDHFRGYGGDYGGGGAGWHDLKFDYE